MRKWYPWLIVAGAAAFSAIVYGRLPDEIPTHWDLKGNVNCWSSRTWAAWLMPAILVAMAVILPRLPAIDPKRENYAKFRPTYDLVVYGTMTLVAILHVTTLGASLGWPISMDRVTPVLVGAMLVLLGNVLPRARPNWLFGIRTPWTLTNDRVWERTHRLGGLLFVIAGIALAASSFVMPAAAFPIVIGAVIVASVVTVVYSYFAWKEETARAPHS
jgi:uncharacterized membrane protein